MPTKRFVLTLVIPTMLGVAVAAYLLGMYFPLSLHAVKNYRDTHDKSGRFTYVTPLLSCGDLDSPLPSEIESTKDAVEHKLKALKQSGHVAEAAVYFRDLNNGPWFGIDQDEEFIPASLLKVPLMMAYYRKTEYDPSIKTKEVQLLDSGGSLVQLIPEKESLVPGEMYLPDELVHAVAVYSNNNAAMTLHALVGEAQIGTTFRELGIPPPLTSENYQISVQKYSSFFRILYNATYLTPEDSEEALSILAKAEFDEGIVAGVPQGIEVAHKFGERGLPSGEEQLHDCGIVYLPGQPYLICVMTRGTNIELLKKSIADISKIIYEGIT